MLRKANEYAQGVVSIADGIALTLPVLLGVLTVILFVLAYRMKKNDKDKRTLYALAAIAGAGALITGGYISLATTAPPPSQNPTAPAAQWKATFAAFTDAGSEIATTIISPDGTHVDLYITKATYGNPNPTTWNATINVFNMNQQTQNTQPYLVQLTYGSVYVVQKISTGANYPALGLLTDGKTYNVVWSAVSSAPTPTVISPGVYQASFTSLQNGQEKAVLTLNGANFAAMTVGQVYEVDLSVGGILLPIFVHPTA